jgi:molecular chaperone HtpG
VTIELHTSAELQAVQAQQFDAFSSLNLIGIKKGVGQLLGLIGREGVFDEYTIHDISHIDKMLSLLDWIIPDETKQVFSPADWLITVLAIYFHDLGLLVTKREFEARHKSGFADFVRTELYGGDQGQDYKAKVESLPPDRAERFLYQEYVRAHHAERIRSWITGEILFELGVSNDIVDSIQELLRPLDHQFKRDLGLICESHHLNDLHDVQKYKVSQPYGDSDHETANLQYSAVLLRTADLLHITSDRTPSIMLRTINPNDPISQEEWAKQMAVRRVRPQLGTDREGNRTEAAPKDTIEVHAFFRDVSGFFGLTSYLAYAGDQLRKSAEWIRGSEKLGTGKFKFPWRYIDDSYIATEGFIPSSFEFTIDQAKILDLLTGHTLYNDSSVVLRELAQNAIDAVRLKRFEIQGDDRAAYNGRVRIEWEPKSAVLKVIDNGTGMTQKIIEDYLLKVGSSRYQDPEFQKAHPGFSPISRFGIGVLSTFMIADEVEIITCHPDEEQARHLSLRSVHGKYLIRLLTKDQEFRSKGIYPHGTIVKLKLRPSAKIDDIVKLARLWIVIPDCHVTVSESGGESVLIGFKTPKEAVSDICARLGLAAELKVHERTINNVTLAYATRWSEFFREHQFQVMPRREMHENIPLGTCVSGIRVDENTPGYGGKAIIALANATGASAPKTNVARSGLENAEQRQLLLSTIYQMYCDHIQEQADNLTREHRFSLTWANQEWKFLLGLLTYHDEEELVSEDLLYSVVKNSPLLLIEHEGKRKAVTPNELLKHTEFWTVDSAFFSSAEFLIREIPSDTSLAQLGTAMQFKDLELPAAPVLCGELDTLVNDLALSNREVVEIRINRHQRRVDLKWMNIPSGPRWYDIGEEMRKARHFYKPIDSREFYGIRSHYVRTMIGRHDIVVAGAENELGVSTGGLTYIFPTSKIANFVCKFIETDLRSGKTEDYATLDIIGLSIGRASAIGGRIAEPKAMVDGILRVTEHVGKRMPKWKSKTIEELTQLIGSEDWHIFSPSAWERKADNE